MRDRIIVTSLFGAATLFFWVGYWACTRDSAAPVFCGIAMLATLIVGTLAAPRLAADAAKSPNLDRGWGAGALVNLAAFVLSAFLFSLLPLVTTDILGQSNVLGIVGGVLGLFVISLFIGLMFLLPALPIGMWVGWLFYRLRGSATTEAK